MRKFIMSDIHGFGNVYYSMMSYLDNLSQEEEIELYINGDLIDRGRASAEILIDIKRRIEEGKFKIHYLGGNHELMMYEAFTGRKTKISSAVNTWYCNGGYTTDKGLFKKLRREPEKLIDMVNFIANLHVYHKFEEEMGNKKIVLVHAACPLFVKNTCNLLIGDNSDETFDAVWTRQFNPHMKRFSHIGNKDYFTILGHTPNDNKFGFTYDYSENCLNIDGGCSMYLYGHKEYNHFPLVEISNQHLRILTFNSNNEIIYGNHFINKMLIPFSQYELDLDRGYLNKKLKVKKIK